MIEEKNRYCRFWTAPILNFIQRVFDNDCKINDCKISNAFTT